MIQRFPGFVAPVARLFELANRSFLPDDIRNGCERFSRLESDPERDDNWYFSFPGVNELRMVVSTESEVAERDERGRPRLKHTFVTSIILLVCLWETFEPSAHPDLFSFELEKREFDRLFQAEFECARGIIGEPFLKGQDPDLQAHQYAVWKGTTGLLVLQQCAYDIQYGLDINYWVLPWNGGEIRPAPSMIDWLFRQDRLSRVFSSP